MASAQWTRRFPIHPGTYLRLRRKRCKRATVEPTKATSIARARGDASIDEAVSPLGDGSLELVEDQVEALAGHELARRRGVELNGRERASVVRERPARDLPGPVPLLAEQ